MAEQAGATGTRVSGFLHSGVPDFSDLLGPPIMNCATEHGVLAYHMQHLLAHAASVTRAWAADVAKYIAQCTQILTDREGYGPEPAQGRPTGESTEIMMINRRTALLDDWFERRANLRARQLRDGPTPDGLSELGRAHELSGLAARAWDAWEPPPLRADGVDMPALVRRWQDGEVTPQEARAAAEWYADYQEWREQLLAGGRYLNADDLDAVRDYEGALAATGLAAAVVAGRQVTRRQDREFHGWERERRFGYERREPALPLAEQIGPARDLEAGVSRTLFEHSDEREAQFRSAEDHRRKQYADASATGFLGMTDDGPAARLNAGVEVGAVKGAEPLGGPLGHLEYEVLTAGANASIEASTGGGRYGLYGGAEAEATLARIGNDELIEVEVGPATVRGGGEVGAGAGATAHGGIYVENRKLHVGGKVGAMLGLGLKGNADLEIDLMELVDMVTPDDRTAAGGGASGGSF
jgi:hypothetical protein